MMLISIDRQNEDEISKILKLIPSDQMESIINKPGKSYNGSETMLMWAAWRHKLQTITELLELGANPNFVNDQGESVSTYCRLHDDCSPETQHKVLEIAKLLHQKGVKLNRSGQTSYSIVKAAREYGHAIIADGLRELGYN